MHARVSGLSPSDAFLRIYSDRIWGPPEDPNHPFNSGEGSTDCRVVACYVDAVRRWLGTFDRPIDVADIGCGDFRVGSQIRPYCARYVAYDCVRPLVESNRVRWARADVEFRVLDASMERPDSAKAVFIRQVLQHLPNHLIGRIVANVAPQCEWLVITEHLPDTVFTPNLDKPIGPDIRQDSGIVLTAEPFSLIPAETLELCRVRSGRGVIVTTAYRMR
jgi:hypothetical protein